MDSREIEKRRIAFDDYSRRDDNGTEYWSARDIMKPLGYSRWENFNEAIKRAIISCETSKTPVECHFREVTKMVQSGVAKKPIVDCERPDENHFAGIGKMIEIGKGGQRRARRGRRQHRGV